MYVAIAAHDFNRAISDGNQLVKSRPDWSRAYSQLGWAFWYAGHGREAIENWQTAASLQKNQFLLNLERKGASIYAQQGVQAYSRYKLEALMANRNESGRSDSDFVEAEWQSYAGNHQAALSSLKQLIHEHNPESLKIAINPAYDPLRAMPEFIQLMQNVGVVIP